MASVYGRGRPQKGEVREKRQPKNAKTLPDLTDEERAKIHAPTQSMFRICDAGIHVCGRARECEHCRWGRPPTPDVVDGSLERRIAEITRLHQEGLLLSRFRPGIESAPSLRADLDQIEVGF